MTRSKFKMLETSEQASLAIDSFSALEANFTTAEEYALSLERTAEALAAENRRLGHQITQMESENRRLRGGAEQMRAALLVFNRLLETVHVIAEQKDRQPPQYEHHPAALNNEQVTESRSYEQELAGLRNQLVEAKARMTSVYSSRSWRLTAPLRWGDDIQRRIVRWLRQAFLR